MLWEPSVPVPQELDPEDWTSGISLGFAPRCERRDAEEAGIPETARIPFLRRPGNGELDAARGLPQPIVAVVGAIPHESYVPSDSTVAVERLEVPYMCIVDDADGK